MLESICLLLDKMLYDFTEDDRWNISLSTPFYSFSFLSFIEFQTLEARKKVWLPFHRGVCEENSSREKKGKKHLP